MKFFRRLPKLAGPQAAVEGSRTPPLEPEVPGSSPGIRTEVDGDAAMITVDLDEFGSDTRPFLLDELAHASGLPIFNGTVEHGYAMSSVGVPASVPALQRCHPTGDGPLHLRH